MTCFVNYLILLTRNLIIRAQFLVKVNGIVRTLEIKI